jgi:15-cis-phytoene synthase
MEYENPDILLALAYAPARVREELETLFYIDGALSRIVHSAREPALAQIKLAWWREQLAGGPARGEPLLERLRSQPRIGDCSELASGWEAMIGDPDCQAHAEGRGVTLFCLSARLCGTNETAAAAAGRSWALAQLGQAGALAPTQLQDLPICLGILVTLAQHPASGAWRMGSPLRMARAAAFALLRR